MSDTVVIDCPECETKVRAEVLAKRTYDTEDDDHFEVYFLECPGCHKTMVGHADEVRLDFDRWEMDSPTRLWPNPKTRLDSSIPKSVQGSIEEARLCIQVKAYSACAVMCGKALEALCKAHGAEKWQLAKSWKELKEKGIIDARLYSWGESLRERRNIGAHATDEDVSREDAIDVLDFTVAICEYVYVLAEKYERFKARETMRKKKEEGASVEDHAD